MSRNKAKKNPLVVALQSLEPAATHVADAATSIAMLAQYHAAKAARPGATPDTATIRQELTDLGAQLTVALRELGDELTALDKEVS